MKLKTSFYHSAIIKNNFARFFPLIIAYSVVWILILPVTLYSQLSYYQKIENDISLSQVFTENILRSTNTFLIIIAAIIVAMITFSYLLQGKNCNMYHALPLRREQLFFSNFISGFSFLLIPLLITFFITIGVGFLFQCVDFRNMVIWLGAVILTSFFFYSFAVFCAMFTGNILALPVFYFVLNFLSVGIETIFVGLFSFLLYGLDITHSGIADIFSPAYFILSNIRVTYSETGAIKTSWGFLWIYGIVAIVMILISTFLYKKRNLETAGDYITIKWVKPIFLYGVTFCFSICFSYFALNLLNINNNYNLLIPIIVWMFIGGFFGYFIARMILFKSIRVIKDGLKGWGIYSIAVTLLIIIINGDILGFQSKIPEKNEVESVSYSIHGYTSLYSDTNNIEEILDIHKSFISNRESIEQELTEYNNIYPENSVSNNITINYHLKNGKTFSRSYDYITDLSQPFAEDSPTGKIEKFINSPEQILESSFPSISTAKQFNEISMDYLSSSGQVQTESITGEDALAVYNAMIEDVKEGNLNFRINYNSPDSSLSSCTLYIEFDESVKYYGFSHTFTLTYDATHTLKALEDLGFLSSIEDLQPYTDYN